MKGSPHSLIWNTYVLVPWLLSNLPRCSRTNFLIFLSLYL
uniref:Uncharacterized protein n=1 Tax=Anguilla anguilla TaxID=7936 RepID=A0A0E9QN26_ANGAN